MINFWETRRGVELAETLIRNLPKVGELLKEVQRLNENLEKLQKKEDAEC